MTRKFMRGAVLGDRCIDDLGRGGAGRRMPRKDALGTSRVLAVDAATSRASA